MKAKTKTKTLRPRPGPIGFNVSPKIDFIVTCFLDMHAVMQVNINETKN